MKRAIRRLIIANAVVAGVILGLALLIGVREPVHLGLVLLGAGGALIVVAAAMAQGHALPPGHHNGPLPMAIESRVAEYEFLAETDDDRDFRMGFAGTVIGLAFLLAAEGALLAFVGSKL